MIRKKRLHIIGCALMTLLFVNQKSEAKISYDHYFSWDELTSHLEKLDTENKTLSLVSMTETPGNKELILLSAVSDRKNPAIFVAANMPGNLPIASSGAVFLAEYLAEHPELYKNYSWYILPCGNPDAYSENIAGNSFPLNMSAVNNDMDDKVNEDGPEDLNNDGFIGMMRYKDPMGTFQLHAKDPRLMLPANDTVNAHGRYKIITEGIDNDEDGQYNEDGLGGVNIAKTFPFQFDYLSKESGKWSGSEKETFVLLEFFSEHPEVCMTFTLGTSDFLRSPFVKAKKESADKKYSSPARYASYFGLDAKQKYSIKEMLKLMQENRPDANVNEAYVYKMLNPGPIKEPLSIDKGTYDFLSESYKKYLKKKFETTFIDAVKADKGSFELWSYYHLGLPSVAVRLWDVPILKSDSVKSKKKLSREEAFMLYNDSLLNGEGFAQWKAYTHSAFKNVEIGGIKKGYMHNPLEHEVSDVIEPQISWLASVVADLPRLSILDVKSKALGKDVYQLDVYVTNEGKIAWPLGIGEITRRPAPVVLLLGDESTTFIQGKARTTISSLSAGGANKYSFVIQSKEDKLELSFDAKNVHTQSRIVKLN